MKKLLGLSLLLAGLALDVSSPSLEIQSAIAKPPDWAPAHGYRRKHDKHDKYEDRHDHDRDEVHYYLKEETTQNPILIVFNRLDGNRDGVITLREWDGTEVLFIRLDKNRDGVLTRTEYSRIEEERGFLANLYFRTKQKMASLFDWLF